ncbi:2-succinyl-5-enolpyruvyl-6-hydroxy-3-cyclohexene-1-carboxylic-acid synthase [Opitutia bacterium ISCC 51]|nr:2-succinyl-5-enolpyruvyl-6-hydroxy-3-cyclohexene-1-carboxylic-acid synthase [Opitutae bacterium ISCC 51]QXD26815.1 2-succinyl-5-enolpyruvyl-6-hydroxy-3-cyclohexene-1-carboxylic-acid synthase [Opitutae bacterium ISCC 52]
MDSLNRANTNSLWSSVLVECLYQCGLRQVVISPGSRSTPLTVAFASHSGIEAIPVLDERSAGFFALGLAKQSHKPVALVCTSGTAAVNYFPAVVEASEACVPLLVLTADRPHELRNCGAGQTIDQIRLYGNYPVCQEEMALPSVSVEALEEMRDQLGRTFAAGFRGPVHLNCPFRDPLPPTPDQSVPGDFQLSDGFYSDLPVASSCTPTEPIKIDIQSGKGFILCGTETPENPAAYCQAVARLAEKTDWPVLADGLSPARNHAIPGVQPITSYDLILRNSDLRKSLKPECVIALGPLPTSKELRKWLSEIDAQIYHVHTMGKNLDPTGKVVQVLDQPVELLGNVFKFLERGDKPYCERWSVAQRQASEQIADAFESESSQNFEGRIAWKLPQWLPTNTPLFVASSMPVRDVEYFLPSNESQIKVYASRGVNGIDGTLSTALGIAHDNQSSVLLTGDLAFLHDSNGLLIRPKLKGHLTVILINNRGGGIFNHLPVASFEPPFEDFFATPQEVDFKKCVEGIGCEYIHVEQIDELKEYLSTMPLSGIRVIEVETDRHRDSEYRKQLFKSISQILV